jgi:WD40 repeat protein
MSQCQHPKMFKEDKGTLFLNFGKEEKEIDLACFSTDGSTLLTVREVGVASIWDTTSCAQIGEIRPTSPLTGTEMGGAGGARFKVYIESVALNNDGTLALLGLNDGTAGIFSTQNGVRLSTFHPPDTQPAESCRAIRAVAFSSDGKLALVGFLHRAVGVWNTGDHTLVQFLSNPYSDRLFTVPFFEETITTSVAASKDNCYVFAGFADMTATLWKLDSRKVVFKAFQHLEDILDVWVEAKII